MWNLCIISDTLCKVSFFTESQWKEKTRTRERSGIVTGRSELICTVHLGWNCRRWLHRLLGRRFIFGWWHSEKSLHRTVVCWTRWPKTNLFQHTREQRQFLRHTLNKRVLFQTFHVVTLKVMTWLENNCWRNHCKLHNTGQAIIKATVAVRLYGGGDELSSGTTICHNAVKVKFQIDKCF